VQHNAEPRPAAGLPLGRNVGTLATFGLASAAALGPTLNAGFVEAFSSARVAALAGGLLLLHLLRFPSFVVTREAWLYAAYVGYMLIQLLWTRDVQLAFNTIVPATAFLLVLVLYSTLLAFHEEQPVLLGTLAGFLTGAVAYTAVTRFPFTYPAEFSYNAIAQLYLFGLFISLILASRSRLPLMFVSISAVIFVHIVATTSIKTNLGILVGTIVAAVLYRRYFLQTARRYLLVIAVLLGGLAYVVLSNEALIDSIRRGVDRVELGVEVLQARENIAGYSGFERRSAWQRQGLSEWTENPVFGYGVEAFRSKFEITSHSTFVDVLYNSGLIGFLLVYGIVISVAVRLYRAGRSTPDATRATIFGVGCCYLFMTFAGNVHYSGFLAVFVAVSTALLDPRRLPAE